MKSLSSFYLGIALGFLAGCTDNSFSADKSSTPSVQPAVAGDKLKITIENDQDGLPLAFNNGSPDTHFYIVIQNISANPLTLRGVNGVLGDIDFEAMDSNGDALEIVGVSFSLTKSKPTEVRLAPGESTAQEIRNFYTATKHYIFPFPTDRGGQKTIMLRAVFEETDFPNAEQQGYWTGKTMSPFYQVLLKHDSG